MERTENQVAENVAASDAKAQESARKGDKAFARVQSASGETTPQRKNPFGSIGPRVKEKLRVAGQAAKQKYAVVRDRSATKAKGYRATVERETQAHPLKAVAYTFAAGAIVGFLVRQTRR